MNMSSSGKERNRKMHDFLEVTDVTDLRKIVRLKFKYMCIHISCVYVYIYIVHLRQNVLEPVKFSSVFTR